jgi:hypothetical protein
MTDTQNALAMCLSKTIIPVEVRTYISHLSLITEQEEETRQNFSHVINDVMKLGELNCAHEQRYGFVQDNPLQHIRNDMWTYKKYITWNKFRPFTWSHLPALPRP